MCPRQWLASAPFTLTLNLPTFSCQPRIFLVHHFVLGTHVKGNSQRFSVICFSSRGCGSSKYSCHNDGHVRESRYILIHISPIYSSTGATCCLLLGKSRKEHGFLLSSMGYKLTITFNKSLPFMLQLTQLVINKLKEKE